MSRLSTNSYIACVYDNHWFFGTILSKYDEDGDVKVKCMHSFRPVPSFHWTSGWFVIGSKADCLTRDLGLQVECPPCGEFLN